MAEGADRGNDTFPQDLDNELLANSTINNTVYSKLFVIQQLQFILKESQVENLTEDIAELDEKIENDICQLWDMTVDQNVCSFIVEHNVVDIIAAVLTRTNKPRLAEICTGILNNLLCSKESENSVISNESIVFLGSVCQRTSTWSLHWLPYLEKHSDDINGNISFILESSCNSALLAGVTEFVDSLSENWDHWEVETRLGLANSLVETLVQITTDLEANDACLSPVLRSLHSAVASLDSETVAEFSDGCSVVVLGCINTCLEYISTAMLTEMEDDDFAGASGDVVEFKPSYLTSLAAGLALSLLLTPRTEADEDPTFILDKIVHSKVANVVRKIEESVNANRIELNNKQVAQMAIDYWKQMKSTR